MNNQKQEQQTMAEHMLQTARDYDEERRQYKELKIALLDERVVALEEVIKILSNRADSYGSYDPVTQSETTIQRLRSYNFEKAYRDAAADVRILLNETVKKIPS